MPAGPSTPPKLSDERLRVQVPASTSNVGPGFDLLGLALSRFVTVTLEPLARGGPHRARRSGSAAAEVEASGRDLVVEAFSRAAGRLDVPGAFAFDVASEIPVGRGFGSSGAAVAAGLLLANALAPSPAALDDLLRIGIELEGHPDNVTASLFGGCTLCHPDPDGDGVPVRIANAVHPSIGFVLAWPPDGLATERARAALPSSVPFSDAVENPRRIALLLEGLRTGDAQLLRIGGEDRLHVDARLALIRGASQALESARAEGAWLATVSGAGSGLVALGPHDRMTSIADAMRRALVEATGGGEAALVEPVFGTPTVERVP